MGRPKLKRMAVPCQKIGGLPYDKIPEVRVLDRKRRMHSGAGQDRGVESLFAMASGQGWRRWGTVERL